MKTRKEYELALKELSDVCKKHGIFLVGTDANEWKYGEITIGVVGDGNSHCKKQPTELYISEEIEEVWVERIGDIYE